MTDNQNETNGANSGWSLRFERDGTEDIAVICDAAGDEIARSRPFWLPYADDPAPPTLSAMRLMHAAPRLLAAVEGVIDYAESEAFCLDKLKDSPEAEAEAERAWKAVEDAQAVIAAVKTDGIEDCEGEKVAALVDVAGDEEYRRPLTIDFKPEPLGEYSRKLLDALRICSGFVQWAQDHGADWEATAAALAFITSAITEADATDRLQPGVDESMEA